MHTPLRAGPLAVASVVSLTVLLVVDITLRRHSALEWAASTLKQHGTAAGFATTGVWSISSRCGRGASSSGSGDDNTRVNGTNFDAARAERVPDPAHECGSDLQPRPVPEAVSREDWQFRCACPRGAACGKISGTFAAMGLHEKGG